MEPHLIDYYNETPHGINEEGYLYCISNSDIMPGIYKVGVTMRDPLDRLKEANCSETWKIPTFKIEFAKKVIHSKDKEKKLHRLLEIIMERVHPKREFFRGKLENIREIFDLLDGEMWSETIEDNNGNNGNDDNKNQNKINYIEDNLEDYSNKLEDRLSEIPEVRVKQVMDLINEVFRDYKVEIKERHVNKHSHFMVLINKEPLLVLENHNNGRGKKGLFTTPYSCNSTKIKENMIEFYKGLDWQPYGKNSPRKQYDTENKTYGEIINILNFLKGSICRST
jgi:hypothetical protein